jgi:hypothetical protein
LIDITNTHKDTEKKYREQISKLEEDLMRTKLKSEIPSRRNSSGNSKLVVNLSKAFEEETHISFTEDSYTRK